MKMNFYSPAFFAVALALCVSCGMKQETCPVAKHNVIWDSPGADSRGSMPLGNGDIGANVWVNPAGELYILIGKTDAWNGNGQLLKIGRIKLSCQPALPVGYFHQELDLETGTLRITGKQDGGRTLSLSVWIDASHPVIHVEGESSEPVKAGVLYDGWRSSPHVLQGDEAAAAYGVRNGSSPVVTDADTLFTRENELLWCHRNTRSIWRETLEVQALQDYPGADKDPLLHHTFGALVYGDGFVSSSPEALTMDKPDKRFRISIAVSAQPSNTVAEWEMSLRQTMELSDAVPFDGRRAAHERYWKDIWQKNYIVVDSPEDSLEVDGISGGYQLQRYMNVCAGRGNRPIKFNGSIFTVDSTDAAHPFNPDYRNWGGCYWFQNTRLPYWAMLHSGDFDLMKPLFKMYMDALPLARYRTMKYYSHAGCFFPETMYFWGTYNNDNYGWNREGRPDGLTDNRYIRYYWQSGIELIAMMQDYYDFTRDGTFLNETLLPFASEIVTFYRQHYPKDQDSKILFEPAQSLETYWDISNPLPEIAGLRFVLPRLLQSDGIDAAFAETCRQMLAEMPETPVGEKDGRKVLLPGHKLQQVSNVENPELYAVFPYRLYGLGKPSPEIAGYSYERRISKEARGWQQDAIQAALLGKTDDVAAFLKRNFNTKHTGSRFPAFWGPNYDWVPDQDHGSVAMRALQNMLIQTEGDDILLFPAWPEAWNVKFKVWAPGQTSVEGELKNGELLNLKVVPESRRKDIQIMNQPKK